MFLRGGFVIEYDVFAGANAAFASGRFRRRGASVRYPKTTFIRGASIGAGAVIPRGIAIGAGAIIGACAVVTKSVFDEKVGPGHPAERHA